MHCSCVQSVVGALQMLYDKIDNDDHDHDDNDYAAVR